MFGVKAISYGTLRKFPSPYGVSFILIVNNDADMEILMFVSVSLWSIIHSYRNVFNLLDSDSLEFTSPYGVSFILMVKQKRWKDISKVLWFSVSLRSIIHSY